MNNMKITVEIVMDDPKYFLFSKKTDDADKVDYQYVFDKIDLLLPYAELRDSYYNSIISCIKYDETKISTFM